MRVRFFVLALLAALAWVLFELGASVGGSSFESGARSADAPQAEDEPSELAPAPGAPRSARSQAVDAEPERVGSEGAAAALSADRARLRLRLVHEGALPTGVRVRVRSRLNERELARSADERGVAHFELDPGTYLLLVDTDSLPAGWLAGWNQERAIQPPLRDSVPLGFWGVEIALQDGEEREFSLPLFRESIVRGVLRDAQGLPLEGLSVVLADTRPGLEGHYYSGRTDEQGAYEIRGVRPGPYLVDLRIGRGQYQGQYKPRAPLRHIAQGEEVWHDLALESGDGTVSGRVVDQLGSPFAGLDIWVYYAGIGQTPSGRSSLSDCVGRGSTDAEGRFLVEGLPRDRLKLAVAPLASLGQLGERPTATWTDALDLDLRRTQAFEVPEDLVARRSRPYRIEGRVRGGQREGRQRVRVEVSYHDPKQGEERSESLRVRNGRFHWIFETAWSDDPNALQPQLTLRATSNHADDPVETRWTGTPVPDTTDQVEFEFADAPAGDSDS